MNVQKYFHQPAKIQYCTCVETYLIQNIKTEFQSVKLTVKNSFTRWARCIIQFFLQPGETECTKIVLLGCHFTIFNLYISLLKLTVKDGFTFLSITNI